MRENTNKKDCCRFHELPFSAGPEGRVGPGINQECIMRLTTLVRLLIGALILFVLVDIINPSKRGVGFFAHLMAGLFAYYFVSTSLRESVKSVVKGGGFGLIGDIIVGIVGSIIAGFLFPRLGISLGGGFIGAVISSAIGAIILLAIIKLIKRA